MSFQHGNGCLIKAAFNGDLMTALIADKRMEIKQKRIAIKTTPELFKSAVCKLFFIYYPATRTCYKINAQ